MAEQQPLDVNMFTSPFQLTKSMYRDIYHAVEPSNPAISAKGKVVIVTGAGGGLGNAVAVALAEAGAAGIVIAGRNPSTLEMTSEKIAAVGNSTPVLAHPTDLSSVSSVKELFERVREKFDKAHVLVNAAGTMSQGRIEDTPFASWWRDFENNVKGTFIPTQSFIQCFGGEGTIINLVSTAVALAVPGISSYASSKLAVIKFGMALTIEYPKMRVFSVHPGIVEAADRGMVVDAFTPFAKDKQALTGGVSLWLSTPKAHFLNGGFLSVNWDVNEMEAHAEEISADKLNQLAFLNAGLSPDGHAWGSK